VFVLAVNIRAASSKTLFEKTSRTAKESSKHTTPSTHDSKILPHKGGRFRSGGRGRGKPLPEGRRKG